jgi:16S rRNA (guanine966-N2)-methyltransferase
VRVIAGEKRGRRLRAPRGYRVRPTAARIKASLFDILASRRLVTGARVLDLFAGTGALGIEALSRGAATVVCVEESRTVARVLRANLAASGVESQATVLIGSVPVALRRLEGRGARFDGVFVDPPYAAGWVDRTLRRLARGGLLADDAWVVVHHERDEPPAETYDGLAAVVTRRFGRSHVALYRRPAGQRAAGA